MNIYWKGKDLLDIKSFNLSLMNMLNYVSHICQSKYHRQMLKMLSDYRYDCGKCSLGQERHGLANHLSRVTGHLESLNSTPLCIETDRLSCDHVS